MFIDDLNSLRARLRLKPTSLREIRFDLKEQMPLHAELDFLDRRLGVLTRHGKRSVYGIAHDAPLVQEYVGARLRRLDGLCSVINKPFFWLGKDAEAA